MPTLSEAISAIKAGRRDEARVMLTQILSLDQRNITALLWMTEVSSTDEERRKYLNRILEIDPNNAPARKGLDLLGKVDDKTLQKPATVAPIIASPSRDRLSEPIVAQDSTKKCPYCAEVIKAEAVICRFCGMDLRTGIPINARETVIPVKPSATPLLNQEIETMVEQGWQVVNKTDTTAQLRKPKQWSQGCIVLFVLFPLLGGLVIPGLLPVAVIGLLFTVVAYLLSSDETMSVSEEKLQEELQSRIDQQRQREEQAKRNEQVAIEKKREREEQKKLKKGRSDKMGHNNPGGHNDGR